MTVFGVDYENIEYGFRMDGPAYPRARRVEPGGQTQADFTLQLARSASGAPLGPDPVPPLLGRLRQGVVTFFQELGPDNIFVFKTSTVNGLVT